MKRLAVLPVVLLALAACASDDGGSSSDGSSSGSSRRIDAPEGAPTVKTFPPETVAFMKAGLKQFNDQDPRWENTRREWIALGPRETEFLVQSMWGALLRMQSVNMPENVERARHELALIGEPSIPLMCAVLNAGAIRTSTDPQTGEERPVNVDDLQRREASEVLSIIGPPAVPAVTRVLDDAETKSGRRYALMTLGNMGERGGDTAARTLAKWAKDDDEVLRVEAVHAMRTCHDAATQSALVAALGDDDELVRIKAAESLASRGDLSMVSVIRSAAQRAASDGRIAESRRMERAAEVLEKHGR